MQLVEYYNINSNTLGSDLDPITVHSVDIEYTNM